MTKVGTSGFQYPEWKGKLYPADLPASKMLAYYSERFSSTEINYSFRRIPSEKTIEKWAGGVPQGFVFSFKAPQKVTHFAKLRESRQTMAYFFEVVSGMEGKLGPILFQLPPTFIKDLDVLREFLSDLPSSMRSAFEFRHKSWFADDVYDVLQDANAALCVAEDEKVATPFVATADFGYLRPRRLDYTAADLKALAKQVTAQKKWSDVFIYFRHEETGVGPEFAGQMVKLLAKAN